MTFSRTVSKVFFPARTDTYRCTLGQGMAFRNKKEHAQNRIKYSQFEAEEEVAEVII